MIDVVSKFFQQINFVSPKNRCIHLVLFYFFVDKILVKHYFEHKLQKNVTTPQKKSVQTQKSFSGKFW